MGLYCKTHTHALINILVNFHLWSTEMNNMEWNYLVSPSQADGKRCVHDEFFLTFIWFFKGVSVQVHVTNVKSI